MESTFRAMCGAAMDLCINAGIMSVALADPTYPDSVRLNFEERLQSLTEHFLAEIDRIQSFGEAFD